MIIVAHFCAARLIINKSRINPANVTVISKHQATPASIAGAVSVSVERLRQHLHAVQLAVFVSMWISGSDFDESGL